MEFEDFKTKIQAMADLMDGWEVEEVKQNDWGDKKSAYLKNGKGPRIYISCDGYNNEDKFSIRGEYLDKTIEQYRYNTPRCWGVLSYNESPPSINQSANRPAKAAVRDLENRFLNEYLDIYRKCEISCIEKEKKGMILELSRENILKSAPSLIEYTKQYHGGEGFSTLRHEKIGYYFKLEQSSYGGTFKFELSDIREPLAIKILSLLEQDHKERK